MTDTCSTFPACPDGERLYDAWWAIAEKHGGKSKQAKKAWLLYRKHHRSCRECSRRVYDTSLKARDDE